MVKSSILQLLVISLFVPLFTEQGTAQTGVLTGGVLDDIYEPQHVPARKPVIYPPIREADVMFKKKIWRILDLRQKINFPLYYPTEPIEHRISLIDLILMSIDTTDEELKDAKGIGVGIGMEQQNTNKQEQRTIEVYDPRDGDEFTTVLTYKGVKANFDALTDTIPQEDPETGEIINKIVPGELHSYEVKRYLMKEIWYFDKQRSMLQVHIIGLCPIRMYTKGADEGGDESAVFTQKQVLWVYYPAFRPLFATHVVFNTQNDAEKRTFEDIFSMRRFESYIYQETNVYDNRRIGEYTKGLDSILESDKITEWLRNWEHDLWEY